MTVVVEMEQRKTMKGLMGIITLVCLQPSDGISRSSGEIAEGNKRMMILVVNRFLVDYEIGWT